MTTMDKPDLIVIGAGPAGLSAALEAARHGSSVLLLDEQPEPGGQVYRNVMKASAKQDEILGPDYKAGRLLVSSIENVEIDYRSGVTVWQVGADGSVAFSQNEEAYQVHGRHIILATGAMERPVPLPGWIVPGVMTAGAAQILMKSGGLVARDAILVGSGPLLYLLSSQMIAAGSPPKALVETQSFNNLCLAMTHIKGVVLGWRQLLKGLQLIRQIRKAGVPRYKAATEISVIGTDQAEAISFTTKGRKHKLDASTVLLHQGVVPNTQISRSLGLKHRWNENQRCFYPVTNDVGQSSIEKVSIAGDGAGISGAKAAEYTGRLAALNALHKLGLISEVARDQRAVPLLRARKKEIAIRPFLDQLYAPPAEILRPRGKTIVCRCEEVTADDISSYAALGCKGPNQTKAFGRSGMGPCQGRFCGATVTEILSKETGLHPEQVGSYRIRAPLKPVTLGELAALTDVPQKEIVS
ncbi:FAD-dependent oxidoreductase [Kiloniella sp.]|uniref:FAD-dependent oxidoreductase n=1 Tax=Kiloniella sp. TaxID=1938587 RepID=UPI003B025950